MDIEKLKKLIRLANNNPNDHEANLAARKACTLIAENDFEILRPVRTTAEKLNQHASNYGGTWADVKRSAEPHWRASQYSPYERYTKDPSSYQEDWFKRWNEYWTNSSKNVVYDPIYDAQKDAWSYDGGKTWKSKITYDKDGNRIKESRNRVCTKCGLEVKTFRFKEEPFVCNVCHWKDL